MTTAGGILILSALVLLFGGFATGVAMSRIRADQPTVPRYLALAHMGAFAQAPLLLGTAFALSLSTMTEAFNVAVAALVSGAALVLFTKDVINWLQGVEDEFRHRGLGYRIGVGFGPLHLFGLVMLTVAVVSSL